MNRPLFVADTHQDDVQYRLMHDPGYRAMIYGAQSQAWYHERAWRRGLQHGGTTDAARTELRLSFEGETNYMEQLWAEQRAAAALWPHTADRGIYAAMTDPIPATPGDSATPWPTESP